MKQDLRKRPSFTTWMLSGLTIGALTMYLADPDRGKRRRALARDKLVKLRHGIARSSDYIDVALHDLRNRAQGAAVQARHRLQRGSSLQDDRKLTERVRQQLGRTVSHPHAIRVNADHGRVTLSGPILSMERQSLLEAVRKVKGVSSVEDLLEVHESPVGISSLQGSGKRVGISAARDDWRPASRALAVASGTALSAYGITRHNRSGMLLAAAGLSLLSRAIANKPLRRMAGLRQEGGTIDLQKTIFIQAPLDRVFDCFSKYENFPHFMSTVQEVRDLGNQRSHWLVKGPAGSSVEWTAILTECKPPEMLAWRSEQGSSVRHQGTIRLEQYGSGTRVSIHMSYSPPGGMLGHAVASLFTRDPKQQMDEDLMRMKQFIENGIRPHDAAQRSRSQPTMY